MNTVVCLARMPEVGTVKNRPAVDLPIEIQIDQIRRCRDLLDRVSDTCEVEVTLAEPFDFVKAQSFFGVRPFFSQQAEGELGQRLCVASIRAFQSGANKTLLIGTGCKDLTLEHLSRAFRILDNHHVVLGPTTDAGFYLLGMTRIIPELFAHFALSMPAPYARVTALLQAAKVSFEELPALHAVHGLLGDSTGRS